MHAVAHWSCSGTVRVCAESWLWEKNPLPLWGIEPVSVLTLAFYSGRRISCHTWESNPCQHCPLAFCTTKYSDAKSYPVLANSGLLPPPPPPPPPKKERVGEWWGGIFHYLLFECPFQRSTLAGCQNYTQLKQTSTISYASWTREGGYMNHWISEIWQCQGLLYLCLENRGFCREHLDGKYGYRFQALRFSRSNWPVCKCVDGSPSWHIMSSRVTPC